MRSSAVGEKVLTKEEILGPRNYMGKDSVEGIIENAGTSNIFFLTQMGEFVQCEGWLKCISLEEEGI